MLQRHQVVIIEFGADFTKTAPLSVREWLISAALGAIALPLGALMRFIPVKVRLSRTSNRSFVGVEQTA